MRAKHRKPTILLALTSTHHGFYHGAARYAAEHDWHVVADMIYDATIPVGWKGDGILSFVGHWEELAKFVVSAPIPVVEISSVRKDLGIPCVMEDNEAIGRLAAEHLLERNLKTFVWAPFWDDTVNEERFQGFASAIRVRLCTAAAGKYATELPLEPAYEPNATAQMGDPHDPIAALSARHFLL
jgi:LacI family transcriptional regulator